MAPVLDQATQARTPTVAVPADLAVQLLGQARQIAADIADIRSTLQDTAANTQPEHPAPTGRGLAPAEGLPDGALPIAETRHADLD
ncbi:hypothetical protein [Dactylosporangium salmoneum]